MSGLAQLSPPETPTLSSAGRGVGGYIDDEVDLDDELEDEPMLDSKPGGPPAGATDYILKAGGDAAREYVVARFVHRMPDMGLVQSMRMYRESEGRQNGRSEAISRDKKQENYFKSFIGRRKIERNKKVGIETIPDRTRKPWNLEVSYGQAQNSQSGSNKETYGGEFEGRNLSRYAVFVMDKKTRTVEVVPIGHLAWYSFRGKTALSNHGNQSTEEVEKRLVESWKKGVKKLDKLHANYENTQEKLELQQGGISMPREEENVAVVGLRRNDDRDDDEENEGAEGLDFDQDQEFDDDDTAQADPDFGKKEPRKQAIIESANNRRKFKELIKDEPVASRPASPGSDSDEDFGRRSPSPSPKRLRTPDVAELPAAKRQKREPSAASLAGAQARAQTVAKPGQVPLGMYAHLLPKPHENPTKQHIIDILNLIYGMGRNITLKELVGAFKYKSEKRAMLQTLLKEVAYVKDVGTGGVKKYHVFLKNGYATKGKR